MRRQTDNSLLTVPRCTNFLDAFLQRIRVSPMRLSTYLQSPSRVISVSRVGPKNGSRCRRIITKSVDSDRLRFTSSTLGYFSAHSLNVNGSDFPVPHLLFRLNALPVQVEVVAVNVLRLRLFQLVLSHSRIRTQSRLACFFLRRHTKRP